MRRSCLIALFASLISCGGATAEQPQPRTTAPPTGDAGLSYEQIVMAAQSYLDAGKPQNAAEAARMALEKRADSPEVHLILARALFLSQQPDGAIAAYHKALSLKPGSRDLTLELAMAYDSLGDYEASTRVYAGWLKSHPDDAQMHHELGLTLLIRGQVNDALESLGSARRLAPKSLRVETDYGYGLFKAGQLDEAAKILEGVIAADDTKGEPLQLLAQVRAAQGKTPEALGLLDRAISAGRTDPRPVRMRAQLRRLSGDNPGALADYTMLRKADPKDPAAAVGAAGALIALDRLDEAREAVDAARELVGDAPPVAFRAAQIAWRQGDKGAVAVITAYAEKHLGNLEAWRELEAAATKIGDRGLAKKARTRVKALEKGKK